MRSSKLLSRLRAALVPAGFNGLLLALLAVFAAALVAWQPGTLEWRDPGPWRWAAAGLALLLFAATTRPLWPRRRATADTAPWRVVHASQTGRAEQIAQQTARALQDGGIGAQVLALHDLALDELQASARLLFVVSTAGEGEAPDSAARFERQFLQARHETRLALDYGLLALGDRRYREFCAFGRRLDAWLQQAGARPRFARIEVDDGDPAAIAAWRAQVAQITGTDPGASWQEVPAVGWTLVERTQLNVGSTTGAPCFSLALQPAQPVHWQAGDVITIELPAAAPVTRDYSIASIPSEGPLRLLVRQTRRPDGQLGIGSGWITQLALPAPLQARIRRNPEFHAPDDARPLLLVGNGTGIASLRALLAERVAAGRGDNWLVFGEREQAHDFHYADDLLAWQRAGLLELDLAFSRDAQGAHYVQDLLLARGASLRERLDRGGAVYVCGSAQGMAQGVHDALVELLGVDRVEQLRDDGRYRRDVY